MSNETLNNPQWRVHDYARHGHHGCFTADHPERGEPLFRAVYAGQPSM